MVDPHDRRASGRPGLHRTDPQMAGSRCVGTGRREPVVAGARDAARRCHLARAGEHLPALRIGPLDREEAEPREPRRGDLHALR